MVIIDIFILRYPVEWATQKRWPVTRLNPIKLCVPNVDNYNGDDLKDSCDSYSYFPLRMLLDVYSSIYLIWFLTLLLYPL